MADDSDRASQDEIDSLLREAQAAGGVSPPPGAPSGQSPKNAPSAGGASNDNASISQDDIDLLISKAEQALASIDDSSADLPDGVQPFDFRDFAGAPANADAATLELMRDVQLDLTIELGRTHMQLENVLQLRQGSVVALDKLAGDPADIYVNGRLIARGEVLVLNDNFCVRVAELVAGNAVADEPK